MFQERYTPDRAGRLANFVGTGLSFPIRIGPTGGLSMSSGPQEIENSIRMILETAPGERVMRPTFGCSMWDQVFENPNASTLGVITEAVEHAIGMWEPRISLLSIKAEVVEDLAGTRVEIRLGYEITSTNDQRNLVYPFYVIPRETRTDGGVNSGMGSITSDHPRPSVDPVEPPTYPAPLTRSQIT